jgi:pyrroloquinoline quinone biosynthesis protein D
MSALDPALRPALASYVRLKVDPVTGEPVLLFPEGLLTLNATAQEIVQRCDGQTSIAAIVMQLADEFDAPEEELRVDVLACLQQLQRQNLLRFTP